MAAITAGLLSNLRFYVSDVKIGDDLLFFYRTEYDSFVVVYTTKYNHLDICMLLLSFQIFYRSVKFTGGIQCPVMINQFFVYLVF